MHFNMENIKRSFEKIRETSILEPFLHVVIEIRDRKKNFLGFFRNHARNVFHIEIHLPERNFGRKKIILGVLERLENSKLRTWF